MRRGRHPTNSFEADSNGEIAVCVTQPTFSLHPINLRWLLLLRRLEKGDRGTLCLSPSSFPLSPLPALEVMKGIPSPLFLLWLILLSLRDCPSRDSDSGGGREGRGVLQLADLCRTLQNYHIEHTFFGGSWFFVHNINFSTLIPSVRRMENRGLTETWCGPPPLLSHAHVQR